MHGDANTIEEREPESGQPVCKHCAATRYDGIIDPIDIIEPSAYTDPDDLELACECGTTVAQLQAQERRERVVHGDRYTYVIDVE